MEQSITLPKLVDSQLIEAARPWIFRADYETVSVEFAMGEYWQLMLPSLPELIASRTKEAVPDVLTPDFVYEVFGGRWEFYMPMFHDMLTRDLAAAVWPKEPIYTTDFGVLETKTGYTLSCLVYFVPQGHFQSDVKPVTVRVAPIDDAAVECAVGQALLALRAAKSMERDKGLDACIEDGDLVWCTLDARIDGALWGAGSLKDVRVLVDRHRLQPDGLYEAFIGKSVGNHQIVFTLSDKFGPLAGKEVRADLIVRSILSYVLPDCTDEFAQQFGKATYAELCDAQQKTVRARFVEDWESRVADAALDELLEQLTFDPLPTEWVESKAKERFDRLLAQTRGDVQKACAVLGVEDTSMALLRMYELARRDAWSIVALLSYGEQVGLVREKTESLKNLSTYLRRAMRHLIEHHVVHAS